MTTALIFVNMYALLILGIVLVSYRRNSDLKTHQDRTFMVLITSNLLMLLLDTVHIGVMDTDAIPYPLFQFITLLLYVLPMTIAIGWLDLTGFFLGQNPLERKWTNRLLHAPYILSLLIALVSLFTGWYYETAPGNAYARGPLYLLHISIVYSYLLLAFINILKNRNSLRRDHFYPLLFFAVPPSIVGFIQTANQDFPFTWAALALSVVMVYLFVLSLQVNTDYLTGLFNRKEYDQKIRSFHRFAQRNRRFGVLLIDLDGFKAINDVYGHKLGDDVLKTFAHLLEAAFKDRSDTIARIGGDEFAVIFTLEANETADSIKDYFLSSMKAFNQNGGLPFTIDASVSALEYDPSESPDLEIFLKRLDDQLYNHKERTRRS